jgi:hypothetical protein
VIDQGEGENVSVQKSRWNTRAKSSCLRGQGIQGFALTRDRVGSLIATKEKTMAVDKYTFDWMDWCGKIEAIFCLFLFLHLTDMNARRGWALEV